MTFFTAIATALTTAFGPALAGIFGNLLIGAALIGAQALFGGFSQRPTTQTPQAQAVINQSTGSRLRGYGWGMLGGTRSFWDSIEGGLFQTIMAHSGRIDAFERFYIGDTPVTVSVDGEVMDAPFYTDDGPYVYIRFYYGYDDQAADALMLERWPGIWTEDHRLRGIAYWRVLFLSPPSDVFQTMFPESYNTPVRCLCRLSLVWDPRDADQDPDDEGTWAWSDTAALCILDYLRHKDGYRRSIDDMDVASFATKASLDEQAIPLAGGGVEKRYRLWGIYSLTDDPEDVLAKMRAASDAELYQTAEGTIAIRGGVWEAPTVTIRDADILGHSMEQGNNLFAAFNELKILYTSPDHDFQKTEATSWANLADQDERGVLSSSLELDMVPSPTQARRLAKIHIAKSNPEWRGTITANLSALDALGERTVRIVLPELDIDDAFFVAGFSIRPDLTGVELSVMSISEASYLWSTAEEGQSPAIPQDTAPDLSLPVPEIELAQDGGLISATATAPDRSGLGLQAQIRAGAGSIWQEMHVEGLLAEFGPVPTDGDPITYQVRARWRGPLNSAGDWSSPLSEIEIPE